MHGNLLFFQVLLLLGYVHGVVWVSFSFLLLEKKKGITLMRTNGVPLRNKKVQSV